MEKTLKTIARDLTWFKDSHTARDGWGRRETEQDNCEKSCVMLHIKEPCLRGRASSQVIRIGSAVQMQGPWLEQKAWLRLNIVHN